jgi:hypothetical protein
MPRYIDADAVIKEIEQGQDSLKTNNDAMWEINKKYYKGLCWAHRIIDDQPTADVVPRERFDRVFGNLKAVLEERSEDKAEVAREIFEEIENTWQDSESCAKFDKALAELKKKYTERCPDCKHFVGCECFSGMTCDQYEERES